MKFEEHEGQLFRMLEEPVPLTTDAKLPCLVRLIQDDSPMGMYNRDAAYFDVIGKLFIAQKIQKNPFYSNTLHAYEKNSLNQDYCIASIHTLEIIGYPVAEGSEEWALWAMMEGNKVINSNGIVPFTLTDDRIVRIDDNVSWDVGHWLRIFDDTTGWQIHKEPKHLLADARKGDLCQRSNGRYTQFHSKHKLNDGTIAYYFDDISGSTNIDGDHCPHECGNNIVSCEPLAPIGSAEWALQMMKLGKDVCRKGQETAYYHICNGGKEIACSLKNEIRLTCGHLLVSKWGETGNDWQLYEPKIEPPREPEYVICKRCGGSKSIANPAVSNTSYTTCPKCGGTGYEIKPEPEQPKYKVGDWVEVECQNKLYHKQVLFVTENRVGFEFSGTTTSVCFDGTPSHIFKFIRKLAPSQVVIHIGCLSGTVAEHFPGSDWAFRLIHGDGKESYINFHALDASTSELVESLLKAMRGGK